MASWSLERERGVRNKNLATGGRRINQEKEIVAATGLKSVVVGKEVQENA